MRAPIREELKRIANFGSKDDLPIIVTNELPEDEWHAFEAALSGATRPLLPEYPGAAYWWDYENGAKVEPDLIDKP